MRDKEKEYILLFFIGAIVMGIVYLYCMVIGIN
jgi:hypothetical protein